MPCRKIRVMTGDSVGSTVSVTRGLAGQQKREKVQVKMHKMPAIASDCQSLLNTGGGTWGLFWYLSYIHTADNTFHFRKVKAEL